MESHGLHCLGQEFKGVTIGRMGSHSLPKSILALCLFKHAYPCLPPVPWGNHRGAAAFVSSCHRRYLPSSSTTVRSWRPVPSRSPEITVRYPMELPRNCFRLYVDCHPSERSRPQEIMVGGTKRTSQDDFLCFDCSRSCHHVGHEAMGIRLVPRGS